MLAALGGDTADFDRHVALEGCCNFRDLGGYRTVDGFTVRTGRLFRADGPRLLTDADLETLHQLGLATVVDLRTHDEGEEDGRFTGRLTGPVEHHLPMTHRVRTPEELTAWTDPEVMAHHYAELLNDGHEAICEVLAILTDPATYPLLLHCSAGKDRTGVLSAIILGTLGVPDEAIVADYALSGPAMKSLLAALLESYPEARELILQAAPGMTAADPATMRQFLATIEGQHQSIPGYVESVGMQTALPYLRANLLTH